MRWDRLVGLGWLVCTGWYAERLSADGSAGAKDETPDDAYGVAEWVVHWMVQRRKCAGVHNGMMDGMLGDGGYGVWALS